MYGIFETFRMLYKCYYHSISKIEELHENYVFFNKNKFTF